MQISQCRRILGIASPEHLRVCTKTQTRVSSSEPTMPDDQAISHQQDFRHFERNTMNKLFITLAILSGTVSTNATAQTYLGNLTANPYLPKAPPQPANTFNNPYGGSHDSPKLYDSQGNFRGNLNANRYDPNSVANPYGQYGSRYSPDSINNPYGAGSRYNQDSPNNPYGNGLRIIGN